MLRHLCISLLLTKQFQVFKAILYPWCQTRLVFILRRHPHFVFLTQGLKNILPSITCPGCSASWNTRLKRKANWPQGSDWDHWHIQSGWKGRRGFIRHNILRLKLKGSIYSTNVFLVWLVTHDRCVIPENTSCFLIVSLSYRLTSTDPPSSQVTLWCTLPHILYQSTFPFPETLISRTRRNADWR